MRWAAPRKGTWSSPPAIGIRAKASVNSTASTPHSATLTPILTLPVSCRSPVVLPPNPWLLSSAI